MDHPEQSYWTTTKLKRTVRLADVAVSVAFDVSLALNGVAECDDLVVVHLQPKRRQVLQIGGGRIPLLPFFIR